MPLPARRIRFSLVGLLMCVTAACLLAAVWGSTQQYAVAAYLQVKFSTTRAGARPRSAVEMERSAINELARVKSQTVINAALASAGVKDSLASRGGAAASYWIDRIQASFPGDGEVLELRIESRSWDRRTHVKVLQEVVEAYLREVERQRSQGKSVPDVTVIQRPMVLP